jgi:hypothetical protein
MLSGLVLSSAGMPPVEAYTGSEDTIVELYIETESSRESLSVFLGKDFTDGLLSTEPEHWKALLGPGTLIAQSQFQNITALFADDPKRGFCACVYKRVSSGTTEVDPIFVDFYIPNQAPRGETLPETIRRRTVTCLQQDEALDR